ncbi:Aldehyde Dehydrogenase OS=Tsukamurella paurometabola (strain ATCC 8368 / DSM / CCUG 35730 /CIP 100753 / JCM 10117 / KCTC 9821 / NBRC 16120 / NCIMB 702349/ NCTC 13040) OX=521096 GN=Tpau_3337 PE=3 SV=1 [Tsukamurella paurometabola]|uniref:Aldehyde Dehydrogenase n=1 Tax=Tsukamurella paurometabola (strain ATCC 8368 / DSM 20162 / CCUG 35730 / CIP 100753 / JCM 10117 / KCTC 9821 / NBRC 16120 / NCIMB 702349 / NCTC 13040) TaxID=521096 RepID=D5UWC2_TSUPD|nr:NAD-dependent succinate-semialdehyde dehydrogenase [Tsukamurella paurometabola]ADG79921.1 Aldehyde Dehydrogenase [Tsukamurella paurometabola DSM 20162]SUP37666.1 Succinate-semialdehyde dehydrogenase [NADP(+)] GabD [Tsukamurella paurometabola]
MATAQRVRDLLEKIPTGIFVNGTFRDSSSGATFPVHDPSTEEVLAEVADATAADGAAALDAAVAAGPAWAATPARERGEILRAAYEGLHARADDFALLMTLEMGKALPESANELKYGAEFFRWFSEEAVRIAGRYTPAPAGTGRILVSKAPVGPCLAITPWNFPLAMGTRKIGPALAAGATMLVKPAGLTPLTMLLLAEVLQDAGVPEGVISVLPTSTSSALTAPLLADPRLRKLTFTGSTGVGAALIEQSAPGILRTSMELGGNAPFVVFDDADIDHAVGQALLAKLRNGGEACTAANRFHVHESVVAEFTDKLVAKMGEYVVGPGIDEGVTIGPLVSADQQNIVSELVQDAVGKGASLRLGGVAPEGKGHFFPPTVLADVPADARILREEVFGPVAPIVAFATEDEAVAAANDTEYGLASYIFTRDLDRALRVADRIDSGMVGVNRGVISDPAGPFGGVKASGFGREGGSEGIEEYLETKYIALQ